MRRLFLSDVHVSPRAPARANRLEAVLAREAGRADEIYILGDLFDFWIGPAHLTEPDYRSVLVALRRTVEAGTRVVLLRGNRDFYLRGFEAATGVEVPPGGRTYDLVVDGRRVHLAHGDTLEARRRVSWLAQELFRGRLVEAFYTALPASWSKSGARFYRAVSSAKRRLLGTRRAAPRDHTLDPARVEALFRAGYDVVVCGHVHREGLEWRTVHGRPRVLYTLGDWAGSASVLAAEDGRWFFEGDPVGSAQKKGGPTGGRADPP